jgi:HAMP domain-containing protein
MFKLPFKVNGTEVALWDVRVVTAVLIVLAALLLFTGFRFTNPLSSLLNPITVSKADTSIPPPIPGCAFGTSTPHGQANPSDEPEPMGAIWCFPLVASPTTRVTGTNDWVDTFATNVQMGRLNDGDMGYRVFQSKQGGPGDMTMGQFINNNHWMIDMVDNSLFRLSGGVLLSPNRSFQFENGKLVVEADAAAGEDGAGGADVFYEVDITPAAAPTGTIVDGLYGYGLFGFVGAVGCRLERAADGGHEVCAMYDNTNRNAGQGGRTWETQGIGTERTATSVVGGYPGYTIPGTNVTSNNVFRICNTNQMDMFCRDRFRFEFTKTSLTIFVNGYKWFDAQGLFAVNPATGADNRIPDSWLGSAGVHVYFTSWINSGQHYPVRLHWGRLAVNPHDLLGSIVSPSAAPTYCLGMTQNTCEVGMLPPPAPAPAPPPSPTPPPPPPINGLITFGNSAIGPQIDVFDSNYMDGSYFRSCSTCGGNVISMSVYVDKVDSAPNNQYQVAIYGDNSGVPGTLIAKSLSGTLRANSWNTIPISATLKASTVYWLVYNTNATQYNLNNMHYINSVNSRAVWQQTPTTFGTWPQTFGSVNRWNGIFSIYATLTK